MFHHMLVPLDGSVRAEQALSMAARLARASQGTITLFQAFNLAHEVRPYGIEAPYLAPNRLENALAEARRSLEQQSHDERLAGIRVQIYVASGNPAEMILAQATEPTEPPVDWRPVPVDCVPRLSTSSSKFLPREASLRGSWDARVFPN